MSKLTASDFEDVSSVETVSAIVAICFDSRASCELVVSLMIESGEQELELCRRRLRQLVAEIIDSSVGRVNGRPEIDHESRPMLAAMAREFRGLAESLEDASEGRLP